MFGKVSEDSFQDILESATCFNEERFQRCWNRAKIEQDLCCLTSSPFSRPLLLSDTSSFEADLKRFPASCLSPTSSTSSSVSSSSSSSSSGGSTSPPSPSSSSSSSSSSSTSSNGKVNVSRYKTELCRPYQEHGTCKYGEKCQFAHGGPELRVVSRHPKYKTDMCRTYHSIGFCPYGPRCHFIHNLEELKAQNSARSAREAAANGANGNASNSSAAMPPLPMFSSTSTTASSTELRLSPMNVPPPQQQQQQLQLQQLKQLQMQQQQHSTPSHHHQLQQQQQLRLRNLSESGYTSSCGSSQSPASLAELDSETESVTMPTSPINKSASAAYPIARPTTSNHNNNNILCNTISGSPTRLPVFSTLSK